MSIYICYHLSKKYTIKTGIHTQTNAKFLDDSMEKEKEQSQDFKEMNLL